MLSAFGSVKLVTVIDPILGIQFRYLMVGVGAAELIIAFFCPFTKKTRLATALVAWLCTNFFVHRLGLWWMDWHRPCNCLGNHGRAAYLATNSGQRHESRSGLLTHR